MIERGRDRRPRYEEPFVWWGPVWELPPERTLVDLIREDVLGVPVAALLWGLLARRASIIVAAGPSGAGKTTMLTALLDCLPPGTRRIYLRGCYESFAFFDDPEGDPKHSVLLVNEISAHLPSYLWGPGVRRTLAATRCGFGLAATAHASSVSDLIGQLAGYPLRVPMSELGAINIVVLLAVAREQAGVRCRVAEVWSLSAGGERGLTVARLADAHDISLEAIHRPDALNLIAIPSQRELDQRSRYLASLAAAPGPLAPGHIRLALHEFNDTAETVDWS